MLVVARQDAGTERLRKWLLIAPVGGLTALVSLEIPLTAKKDVYPEAAIRTSFASLDVARQPCRPTEQLALVPFKLGDLAGFQVAGVVPGRAVQLTDGGQEKSNTTEQPASASSASRPAGRRTPVIATALRDCAFASPPNLKDVRILSSEPMRIGGQPGHEMRVTGKDAKSGADVEVVQWLRFGSGAYLRMVGFAPKEGWVEAFSRFRAVRDGWCREPAMLESL